jgi:hypothetical protein
MFTGLREGDELALHRALEVCQNSRAEFSTDVGPALRELRRVVDTLTLEAVRHARERRDNSWVEIGAGLGVTRQGAKKKYGNVVA